MKKPFLITCILLSFSLCLNAQWQHVGLDTKKVNCIVINDSNVYAGTEINGIYLSTNYGTTWNQFSNVVPSGSNPILSININDQNILAGTRWGGLYMTTNNGLNWTQINNGLTGNTIYSFLKKNSKIIAGTNEGVFFSSDNGMSWGSVSNGLPFSLNICNVFCITMNDSNLYAAIGYSYGAGGIYYSTDNGGLWAGFSNGLFNGYYYSVASIDSNIYAGAWNGGVTYSHNNGQSWVFDYLSELSIYSTRALLPMGTNILAGTDIGIFLTNDFGVNWQDINDNLPSDTVLSIALSDSNIFIGTYKHGIWRRPISDILNVKENKSFNNVEIYPNPTTDKLYIKLKDFSSKEMIVKILNITGQQIKTFKFKHNDVINIDVSDYVKGIYFLQFQYENKIENRKLIIK